MAQSPASQPSNSSSAVPTKKPRSPAEKVIVYGGILLLLGLVAFQARARMGYTMTLNKLQDRLEEDEGKDANPLLLKDLDQYIVGWPTRTEESRGKHLSTIELTWPGLTSSFGLKIGYDPTEEGGAIMALETKGYEEPSYEEQTKDLVRLPDQSSPLPGAAEAPPALAAPPAGEAPDGAEPAAEAAATTEPAAETPASVEPATEAPAATEPAAETPAAETPTAAEPAAEAPATTEPAAETPATAEPVTEQPDVGK